MPPKKKTKSKVPEPEPEYEEEDVVMTSAMAPADDGDADDEGTTRCVCGMQGARTIHHPCITTRTASRYLVLMVDLLNQQTDPPFWFAR